MGLLFCPFLPFLRESVVVNIDAPGTFGFDPRVDEPWLCDQFFNIMDLRGKCVECDEPWCVLLGNHDLPSMSFKTGSELEGMTGRT